MSATRLVAAAVAASGIALFVAVPETTGLRMQPPGARARLAIEGRMPSLEGATTWLNSKPLAAADLRGKVTLVDFWTYTCINWIRTAPYVRAWAEKYKAHGLVVIGVHAPEFGFEKNLDNVTRAVTGMRVAYPVAVDNDHRIWRAFENQYWPAVYLVDARGLVRFHQFGEGGYVESERAIQQLLADAGAAGVPRDLVVNDANGVEAAPDWANVKSPENYLGYERTQRFSSPGRVTKNAPRIYTAPARLTLNQWALDGEWTVGREAVALASANGRLVSRFRARDLHLVMGPSARGSVVRFRVRVDGQPPGAAHGVDVDAMGQGVLEEQRLYQLIRQPGSIGERQFEIEFLDSGVELFAFTFG